MIQKFIKKKLIRLINSKKVLRLFFYYHKFFKDKKLGNIGFDFTDKKTRLSIVQEIINKKNYENYLEIGCFDNELFNHINCKKKVGVDRYLEEQLEIQVIIFLKQIMKTLIVFLLMVYTNIAKLKKTYKIH